VYDHPNDYGIAVKDLIRYPRPPWRFGVAVECFFDRRHGS
jgi:hypothetical protein